MKQEFLKCFLYSATTGISKILLYSSKTEISKNYFDVFKEKRTLFLQLFTKKHQPLYPLNISHYTTLCNIFPILN